MNTSALNAEELRRENGIVTLQAAFARCVDVLSNSSNPEDMAVQVTITTSCSTFRPLASSLLPSPPSFPPHLFNHCCYSLPPSLCHTPLPHPPLCPCPLPPSPLTPHPLSITPLTPHPLYQVCTHICRCYRVSAQFEACREAITEVPAIVKDICRVLYYKVYT